MPVKNLENGELAQSCPDWVKEKFDMEKWTLDKAAHKLLWSASEAVRQTLSESQL